MKLYNVGVDELSKYELDEIDATRFVWMVYWYEGGGHEGSGKAVALGNDGLLYGKSLGHCSCYGLTEGGFDCKGQTMEEFLAPKEHLRRRLQGCSSVEGAGASL